MQQILKAIEMAAECKTKRSCEGCKFFISSECVFEESRPCQWNVVALINALEKQLSQAT